MRLAALVALAVFLPASAGDDQLGMRLVRFAEEYNRFVTNLRAGMFDVRGAKRLSRFWHDVETSGSWPKER